MSTTSLVGINLSPVNYWSTEYPFLDRMKTAGSWGVQGAPATSIVLDENGWPTKMPAGATSISTMVALDPASAGTSNTYVLTYKGNATFRIPGATIISSKSGEITFQVSGANPMQTVMISSIDGSKPLADMHIVRQDQVALFNKGEIFNPAFTDKISSFDTLRYMDWGQANIMNTTSWANRTTTSSYTWSTTTSSTGVPIEVMVALANKTHTNMWLNVPTTADDDYVRQMLTYVRDNLDPSLKVKVEYSNEVWNWGFPQSRYASDMANKLWGVDANGDGKIDPNNPAEGVTRAPQQYYGYRAAQVATIAKSVFGDAAGSRLENVLATQSANTGLEKYIIQGIARANAGDVSSLFDDYAVTTYFGSNLSGQNAQDRAVILGWAKSGATGLDAAFKELAQGGTLTGWGSLPSLMAQWTYQAGVANQYGLNLVAYEGGLDLNAKDFSATDQPTIMDFFARLEADPRMAGIYAKMVDDFSTAGGTQLNAYTDAQSDRTGGLFGTLKSIYGDTSPAWDALVNRQTSAAATQTKLSHYTFDAGQTTITYTGNEAFTATGNDFDNVITGGRGKNTLSGGAGNDTLIGGREADLLDGGTGADIMMGKGGDDVYIVDNPGDKVVETPNAGNDEVRTSLSSYTLPANVEKLTFTGTGGFSGSGNELDNIIVGGDQGNVLSGGSGNDTLIGGAGADTLDGGTGADKMVGGAGNDVYVVDDAGDVVTERPGEGVDEVRTSLANYALPANVENLTYTGKGLFTGTGNELNNVITAGNGGSKLSGGAGNDTLVGGAGADVLDGGTGADTMSGGAGNDIYVVDDTNDKIIEAAGQGTDEVRTTLTSYTLGSNLENLTYTGSGAFVGTGNELANTITGGNGGNKLYGGDGNDVLNGGSGADYLDGGSGADRMNGGDGNDIYIVDNPGDIVTEAPNGGIDEVRTGLAGYALTANVENLVYTGPSTGTFSGSGNASDNVITGSTGGVNRLYGGDGNDTLIGGSGADLLDGGSGADRMVGGAGDDTYVVDNVSDVVVELPGGGTDTVNSSISYTLGVNVENLRLTGTANINGIGNEANNTIIGNAGNNTISAGGGNDVVYGGAGNDYINGGNGNDQLFGEDGNDVLVDGGGDDYLNGGAGDDILIGGPGKDTMVGGTGADRFVFQQASDLGTLPTNTSSIQDFNRAEGDKIDLSQFDANTTTAKKDAFTFLGDKAFTKHAGELRVTAYGGYWNVQGDLNGDGIADISLNVSKGSGPLIASDFIFA